MAYIHLKNIALELPIYDSSRSFRHNFLKPLLLGGRLQQDKKKLSVTALQNLSLELSPGTRLGLIGGNGAGKSSLLRLLARIYEPSRGSYHSAGPIASLFNLGFGMDTNCTGHENIHYICKLRGLNDRELHARYQSICDFSELGEYLDFPLKTYSLGMQSRLAFAIVTALKPEILLLDETFGVGDERFITKVQRQLDTMLGQKGILVFASHGEALLRRVCNKILWLERGEVKFLGELDPVFAAYAAHNQQPIHER